MFNFGGYTYSLHAIDCIMHEMIHQSLIEKNHFDKQMKNRLGARSVFNFLKRRGFLPKLVNLKGGKTKAHWTIYDSPYLIEEVVRIKLRYNPAYGDERICDCGHEYYRHFDSYEDMHPCGCKYCGCYEFIEEKQS